MDSISALESTNSQVETYLSTLGPKPYSSMDLEKLTSNFSESKLVGIGAYGKVYRGQFPGGLEVAVKVLKNTGVAEETFLAEVRTMQASHRNLIKLYGYCFQPNGLKALVYEYMENGSLEKILYEDANSLEWAKLYDIAIQVAKGLNYLHDGWHENIIHYDIKASNVLLDINHSPRITDFGMAKLVKRDVNNVDLSRIRGTDGYIAPEIFMRGFNVTNKCDVFSFGMMLFEILGRRKNGKGENWFPAKVWNKFKNNQLEDILQECGITSKDKKKAKLLSTVAIWCTQFAAEQRPSMTEVVLMLEERIPVGNAPPPPFPNLPSSNQTSELMVIPEIYSDDDLVSHKLNSSSAMTSNGGDNKHQVNYFVLSSSSALKIQKGDITKWSIDGASDAIVNPTNEWMLQGDPEHVDGAIHRAAGPELRVACNMVQEVHPGVRCPTGEAKITRAFKLPVSHVIHTAGPMYNIHDHPEVLLRSSYRNCLRLAKENNIQYIAFPAISCGFFGFPFKDAATIALSTVKEFSTDFKEVHFVLFSDDIYKVWLEKATSGLL